MRLIMAKMHFRFDLEAVNKSLDWTRESKFHMLWGKPALKVYVRERQGL